jgi:hypothetical protein
MAVATGNTTEDAIVIGDSGSESGSGGGSDGGGGGMPPLVRLAEEEEEEEEEEEDEEDWRDAEARHPNFMVMNLVPPYASLVVDGIKDVENRTLAGTQMVGRANANFDLVVGIVESKNGQPAIRTNKELELVDRRLRALGRDGIKTYPGDYPRNPGCIIGFVRFGGSQRSDTCCSPWASGKRDVYALSIVPGSATRLAVPIPCEGAQTPLTRFGPRREVAEIAFRKAWMAAEAEKVAKV